MKNREYKAGAAIQRFFPIRKREMDHPNIWVKSCGLALVARPGT